MSEINYSGKQLAELFAADLAQQEFDVRSIGELVHFTYKGEDYYAFLRAVSYAGNPHPKNRFRAQMPKRPYLESYKDNGGVFLFVGYDQSKDVYAIWNPYAIRPRINQKDTVSLFCEEEALNTAQEEGICWSKLPNGGLYVTFDIKQLSAVLDNLIYFQDETPTVSLTETSVDVTSFINSMIKEDCSTLEIIEACMDKFATDFPEWDYLTWRSTIVQCRNAQEETEEELEPTVEEDVVEDSYDEAIHDIRYYRHCFKQVKAKGGLEFAARKYVMLLSLLDYLPKCPSTNKVNHIVPLLATWEGIFINNAKKYLNKVGRESTLFSNPFVQLADEPFWHLITYDQNYKAAGHAMKTFEKLQDIYRGVEIDDELAELIQNSQTREELRTIILNLISQKNEVTAPKSTPVTLSAEEPNHETLPENVTQQDEKQAAPSTWDRLINIFHKK